ncbi:MAG TPA: alpha/beta hydrolase [Bacteroidaceae bacterium]|jgi:dipeptidyl aminopeptidase/acylaminoacyl peptidase|nr:alpha/beta hydrolase [Bacteroidaceae bacterium]
MKKKILTVAAAMMSLVCFAQFPGGGFGGGFPGGGTPPTGGGFPGLGGDQSSQTRAEYSEKFADINYAGDDGQVYHTLDIYLPKEVKEKYPVLVHIYGSAWSSNSSKGAADINTICAALLNAGYAVVTPNHRSIADAQWPAQVNDIKAVIRFIRANADKYKFDTSFIATSGFSSGGHLSAVTALSNGVKIAKRGTAEYDIEGNVGPYTGESSEVHAFCSWSGPTELLQMDCGNAMAFGAAGNSPEERLIGAPKEGNEDKFMLLSASGFLDKDDVAGYLFHGDADFVVASCVSQYLYDQMQETGVESYILREPQGGHGMGMYSEDNLKKMTDFLDAQRANTILN